MQAQSVIDRLLSRRFQDRTGVEPKRELDRADKLLKQLQKKVKDGQGLQLLLDALEEGGNNTKCVCMPRNGDGRSQVAGQKVFPHVTYVEFLRMYRYPNLKSHNQVRPVSSCHRPFDRKMAMVCVNPYHYYLHDNVKGEQAELSPTSSRSSLGNESYSSNVMDTEASSSVMQPLSISTTMDMDSSGNWISPADSGYGLSYISDHVTTSSISPHYNPNSDANMNASQLPVAEWGCNNVLWCKVYYWELSKRIGDPFVTTCASFFIDGYTAPNEADRFCLGALSNIDRDPRSMSVIHHIDRGVRIYCGYGEVGIECVGVKSVFVQSLSCNMLNKWNNDHVFKLQPGESMRIFSQVEFANLLDPLKGYSYNNQLKELCTFRISFVKGWSGSYPLQSITQTPCWVECLLIVPMHWLDRVLAQMPMFHNHEPHSHT